MIRTMAITAFFAVVALGAGAQSPPKDASAIKPGPTAVTDPTAVPVATGWRAEDVVTGLEHPWGMAFMPNGDVLVTERPGRLRLVKNGKLAPEAISGVPTVLALRQGGLLDVSLHPQFEKNREVYLCYSAGEEGANGTRAGVGVLSRDGKSLTGFREIFRADPLKRGGFHFGCRFLWLADGTALLSLGDGGFERDRVQDLGNHFGKVVRFKADGAVATDNPYHSRADAKPEVWSFGHRNIQGLAQDAASQRIFATEHGAQGGDELNILAAGANFGWKTVTYAVEYGPERKPIAAAQSAPGMVDPIAVFTPSIAPSGLAVYQGAAFPAWRGDVLVGGLITGARTNPGSIFRVGVDAAGKASVKDRIPADGRVRDVRVGPDGFVYLLTDEAKGKLVRIRPQ